MNDQKFPPGWDEERVRWLIAHYEIQTEDERCAEIEAAQKAGGIIPEGFRMSLTLQELKDAASDLPAEERAELAQFLLRSFAEQGEEGVRAEWLGLAGQRMGEIRAGKVAGIPAEQVEYDDSPWTKEELQALAWEAGKQAGWEDMEEYDEVPEKS